LLGLHQSPLAAQLVASEFEEELPLLKAFVWVFQRDPDPLVPYDYGSGSVIAFRYDALELAVLDRVVFSVDSQPLVLRIRRRALGNRPRNQDPVHLQTEVIVDMACSVLLDHEEPATQARSAPERFRGPIG
jgi:hypothetical protein